MEHKPLTAADGALIIVQSAVETFRSVINRPMTLGHLIIVFVVAVAITAFAAYVNAGVEYTQEVEASFPITTILDNEPEPPVITDPTPPQKKKDKVRQTKVSVGLKMDGSVQTFIKRFAHVAQAEQAKYGIPASISLAQGLIESANGRSYLAVNGNNYFGVRSYSGKGIARHDDCCTKRGLKKGSPRCKRPDKFKRYDTAWESWRCHSKVLMNDRYQKRIKGSTSYKVWARALKAGGYATDKRYAEKLVSLIEKYRLYEYDTPLGQVNRKFASTN